MGSVRRGAVGLFQMYEFATGLIMLCCIGLFSFNGTYGSEQSLSLSHVLLYISWLWIAFYLLLWQSILMEA